MDFDIKIDWLSFSFKATEEDQATYPTMWAAFLHYFPNFEDIMRDCVVFRGGRGQYYDNCVAWNDNILICWDNDETTQSEVMGSKIDSWSHGINVCIPSHGLYNIWQILELPEPDQNDKFFYEYKEIYQILKDRHCQISRLDIALDDFTKKYYPHDYLDRWVVGSVCSPCSRYSFVASGKLGGETFYIGGRSNKFLRIYNKESESNGKIKSIRYEIELHNRYANEVSEMILNDNFDFAQYFRKYFCTMKVKGEGWNLDKRYAAKLPDDPEFIEWLEKVQFCEQSIKFPKTPNDVNLNKTEKWITTQCLPSLQKLVKVNGIGWLFDQLSEVVLSPKDQKLIEDTFRIRGIRSEKIPPYLSRSDIAADIFNDIRRCNIL